MTYDALKVGTVDGVTTIELARPHVRNALTLAMVRELVAAIRAAAGDHGCSVVVVTGAGSSFCSGLDLIEQAGRDAAEYRELLTLMYQEIPDSVAAAPKPVIAAVNGPVRAGGCTIAFSCDLLVAKRSATFALPEIHVGLLPGYHLDYLPRVVGKVKAFELAFGAATMDADEAEHRGLVNQVIDDDEWVPAVDAFVEKFRGLSTTAVELGKAFFYQGSDVSVRGAGAVELLMSLDARTRGARPS